MECRIDDRGGVWSVKLMIRGGGMEYGTLNSNVLIIIQINDQMGYYLNILIFLIKYFYGHFEYL